MSVDLEMLDMDSAFHRARLLICKSESIHRNKFRFGFLREQKKGPCSRDFSRRYKFPREKNKQGLDHTNSRANA